MDCTRLVITHGALARRRCGGANTTIGNENFICRNVLLVGGNHSVLDAIKTRQSISKLAEPAPNDDELRVMLEAAASAPDHKELSPWRFVVLRNDARHALGEIMAGALVARDASATQGQIDKERAKPLRAPVVIAAGVKRIETKLPFVELICAGAAATQNLLLAAHDLGYGAIWRTGAAVRDHEVKMSLGFSADDELLALVYVGTSAVDEAPERRRSSLDEVVSWRS